MKVAHLITSKVFAGIEQHVFELAAAMNDQTDHIILCDKSSTIICRECLTSSMLKFKVL